jgi:hypothetical protein
MRLEKPPSGATILSKMQPSTISKGVSIGIWSVSRSFETILDAIGSNLKSSCVTIDFADENCAKAKLKIGYENPLWGIRSSS